jgi:hypothetical protein
MFNSFFSIRIYDSVQYTMSTVYLCFSIFVSAINEHQDQLQMQNYKDLWNVIINSENFS